MEIGNEMGKIICDIIQDGITNTVNDKIRTAPFTQIKWGFVTNKNTQNKTFTIKIENAEYPNMQALVLSYEINNNDVVIVVVPNNQMSNAFILGKINQ